MLSLTLFANSAEEVVGVAGCDSGEGEGVVGAVDTGVGTSCVVVVCGARTAAPAVGFAAQPDTASAVSNAAATTRRPLPAATSVGETTERSECFIAILYHIEQ